MTHLRKPLIKGVGVSGTGHEGHTVWARGGQ